MESKKELISVRGQSGITPTGWELSVATEQQWIVAGEVLLEIDQARQWWLGDWFNACKSGDGREACDLIGINYKTARNCGNVSRKIKLSRRRGNLSYTHHAEVAFIDEEAMQDDLLTWAAKERASTKALRAKVRKYLIDTSIVVEEKKLLPQETDPEIKEVLKEAIKVIQENAADIWTDDLTELVNTVVDNVDDRKAASVLFWASKRYAKIGPLTNRKPKVPRVKSDVEKMVNMFHSFLRLLEKVRHEGHKNLSQRDRRMMDQEFRLMVPRALRLFDWMGIDLQNIVTNYVNRIKEVSHVQQDTERLVGD